MYTYDMFVPERILSKMLCTEVVFHYTTTFALLFLSAIRLNAISRSRKITFVCVFFVSLPFLHTAYRVLWSYGSNPDLIAWIALFIITSAQLSLPFALLLEWKQKIRHRSAEAE